MDGDEVFDRDNAVRTIIRRLQKTEGITQSQLLELFRRFAGRNASTPGKLDPAILDTWDLIIFRGSRKKVIGKITPLFLARIEETLKYLELLPSHMKVGKREWDEYLREILAHLGLSGGEADPDDKKRNPKLVKDALSLLLGMDARHYGVSDAIAGAYYGYRRSSNSGRIVRFYIKINPASGTGLLSFDNFYRQEPDHWIVRGHGFDVGAQTYMIGHAHEATDPKSGLGIRFFVLSKFRKFGWVVGLLNSLDRNQVPIASRIVLIPAEQHRAMRALGTAPPVEKILSFISSRTLAAGDLNEIDVPTPKDLNGIEVSTLVKSLIWNGTLRTLHRPDTYVPTRGKEEKAYQNVFDFQKRALEPAPPTTNDIKFFTWLFDQADIREMIMSRLPPPRQKL